MKRLITGILAVLVLACSYGALAEEGEYALISEAVWSILPNGEGTAAVTGLYAPIGMTE